MTEGGQEAVRAVIDHGDILHCKLRRPSPPLAEMQAGVYS